MSRKATRLRNRRQLSPLAAKSVTKEQSCISEIQRYSSWYGCLRLLACTVNIGVILGMYSEYLWAADFPQLNPQCQDWFNRRRLPLLDFMDCFHRYTFSESMLRGQNLLLFCVLGTPVAITFSIVEHKRTQHLGALLQESAEQISSSMMHDEAREFCLAKVHAILCTLPVYFRLMSVAFVSVLFLTPFHLGRPLLHYGTVGVAAGCMFMGVFKYRALPLSSVVELSSTNTDGQMCLSDELRSWAARHQLLRQWGWVVIALHFVLPATVALHDFLWMDTTARIWGAFEVATILSYQVWVAFFACDDFNIQLARSKQQSGLAEKAPAHAKDGKALLFWVFNAY